MWSYCLKCRKITESKNPRAVKAKNRRIMVSSNCGDKKSRFIREKEANGLLSGNSLTFKGFLL